MMSISEMFYALQLQLVWRNFVFSNCYFNFVRKMQINNAGSNAYSFKPLVEASDEDLM